ncbi:MAG TPA: hypothetical protein VLG71_01545, partial [Candidatus Limnocylindria bacterium]|nr:hypothetical protein [Candidatus Limnocylindria bacterium]
MITPADLTLPFITIWIHGTYPTTFVPSAVTRFQPDPLYKFFYCKPGLHSLTTIDSAFHTPQLLEIVADLDPERFAREHLYIFGWSGELSRSARTDAAQELYLELQKLMHTYVAKYGAHPPIRLITHSHGGNVALKLALFNCGDIKIKQLFVLACPVQQETEPLIEHHMFERIYSIHSHTDMIQVLDPQGLPHLLEMFKQSLKNKSLDIKKLKGMLDKQFLFSGRHFKPHPKLTQIHLKLDGQNLLHIDFLLSKFIKNIP